MAKIVEEKTINNPLTGWSDRKREREKWGRRMGGEWKCPRNDLNAPLGSHSKLANQTRPSPKYRGLKIMVKVYFATDILQNEKSRWQDWQHYKFSHSISDFTHQCPLFTSLLSGYFVQATIGRSSVAYTEQTGGCVGGQEDMTRLRVGWGATFKNISNTRLANSSPAYLLFLLFLLLFP